MDKRPLEPGERRALLTAYVRLRTPRALCLLCGDLPYRPIHGDTLYSGVCYHCKGRCDHGSTLTGYIIKSNGAEQPRRVCFNCGVTFDAKSEVGAVYDLLLDDLRDGRPCERCGDTASGVELHHYAPRNTFRDADSWATGWLCIPCHREWHTSMDGYRWHARAKRAQ